MITFVVVVLILLCIGSLVVFFSLLFFDCCAPQHQGKFLAPHVNLPVSDAVHIHHSL